MAFSLLNGLSQMGSSLSTTLGAENLENQKAEQEKQQAILTDQLSRGTQLAVGAQAQGAAASLEGRREIFEGGQTDKQIAANQSLETGRELNAKDIAGIQAAGAAHVAGIQAGAMMADTKAQIAAGAIETGIDANTGDTLIVNKLTGKVSPIMGPDGKTPLQLTNPAVAQMTRDVVNSTNEQIRSTTQQYHTTLTAAQKDVADALKASSGDQKDPDVVAARAREQSITNDFNSTIQAMNARVNAQVMATLHQNGAPAPTGTASRPPLASFVKQPAAAPSAPPSAGSVINNTPGP